MLTFISADVLQTGIDRDRALRALTELGLDPSKVESVQLLADRAIVTGFLDAPSPATLTCTVELLYGRRP